MKLIRMLNNPWLCHEFCKSSCMKRKWCQFGEDFIGCKRDAFQFGIVYIESLRTRVEVFGWHVLKRRKIVHEMYCKYFLMKTMMIIRMSNHHNNSRDQNLLGSLQCAVPYHFLTMYIVKVLVWSENSIKLIV